MPTLVELQEKRAAAGTRITELANRINTEKRDFTADEQANWDAANIEYNEMARQIETEKSRDAIQKRRKEVEDEQRLAADDPNRDVGREDGSSREERRKRRERRTAGTDQQRALAMRAWARSQYGKPLRREEREACQAIGFNPRGNELHISLWPDSHRRNVKSQFLATREGSKNRSDLLNSERRANLSAQIGTSGAYLVAPGTLASAIETNLLAFGGVRQVADEMTTTSGEPLFWPIVDDTANVGVLLGENTQAMSSGVNPAFRLKAWYAYKFSSTAVLIPSELLEDSNFDMPSMIGEGLGVRLGRGSAPYYATGTGNSQPEGIVTGSTLGITTASSTAITFDEFVRLVHTIDPAYRSMPGVGWLMHDLIVSYLRRIKDGTGKPIWQNGDYYLQGFREGVPDRFLGYGINICQELAPTVASGNKTVLFGVLNKYKIRRVGGVRMYRLEERFRDLDQTGFVAFMREDGKLLDAGTAPVKYMLQA